MKNKCIFYLFLFLTTINTFSQTENKINRKSVTISNSNNIETAQGRVNSTFLLLGSLNDYMNYNYGSLENQFDRYYPYEKPLMNYVDSIVKKDFNINFTEDRNCFISKEMLNLMNSFYIKDSLNNSLFNSNDKKLSFLLGVYYRNGEKINDNIYKIQLANSPKHNNVYAILKELNCQNIFYKRLDNIPRIDQLYFQPTEIIKNIFATIEKEKEKLFNSKLESLQSLKINIEDYKKELQKGNLEIIQLFSKK